MKPNAKHDDISLSALARCAREAGVTVPEAALPGLAEYLQLLCRWNKAMNLVGAHHWRDAMQRLAPPVVFRDTEAWDGRRIEQHLRDLFLERHLIRQFSCPGTNFCTRHFSFFTHDHSILLMICFALLAVDTFIVPRNRQDARKKRGFVIHKKLKPNLF